MIKTVSARLCTLFHKPKSGKVQPTASSICFIDPTRLSLQSSGVVRMPSFLPLVQRFLESEVCGWIGLAPQGHRTRDWLAIHLAGNWVSQTSNIIICVKLCPDKQQVLFLAISAEASSSTQHIQSWGGRDSTFWQPLACLWVWDSIIPQKGPLWSWERWKFSVGYTGESL